MRNRTHSTRGFTLIELLVVVSVISILAAIAIPQFATYRAKGFDARMEYDARNAATAQEAYFINNDSYSAGPCESLPGFSNSAGSTCASAAGVTGAIASSFTATVTKSAGNAATYTTCVWESAPSGGVDNLSCS